MVMWLWTVIMRSEEHLQLVVSNGFLVVLGVELVWSRSIAQCLCTAYRRNKTPHVLSSPRRPESAFPGPISHHLCGECSKSIFLSVCLFLSFMPYVILLWFNIVTLVCLSPQSPLFLSLRCSCLSLILVPVHAGSWRGVVLWSSALFVFTCCLLICLFLFCDSILFSFTKVLEVLFCLPAGWLFSNRSQVFIGCPKCCPVPNWSTGWVSVVCIETDCNSSLWRLVIIWMFLVVSGDVLRV